MKCADIGKQIKARRIARSWKQEELAEKTNLSVSYIGMIERGEKIPRLETFIRIANALEVSADELLSGVMNHGYKVRMSQYVERIGALTRKDQQTIYDIIDVFFKNK